MARLNGIFIDPYATIRNADGTLNRGAMAFRRYQRHALMTNREITDHGKIQGGCCHRAAYTATHSARRAWIQDGMA